MERARLCQPEIRADGCTLRATTDLAYTGAYQLTLITVLPDLAIELHSSYLGHPDAGETHATHLELAPDRPPETRFAPHGGGDMPVADERQRCLYDHLAQLQRLLESRTAHQVAISVPDAALVTVESV